jgi:hypothetical protein
MFFFVGFLLGLLREFLVIGYYRCIQGRRAWRGSALTLGISLLDLFIIAKLAWDRNLWMMGGYILGETIGTNLSIRVGR